MKTSHALPLFLAIALLFSACATRQKKQEKPSPRYLGTVATIRDEAGFVLIEVNSNYSPAVGADLITISAENRENAKLRVGTQKMKPFIVADIINGAPEKGEKVYELVGSMEAKIPPAPRSIWMATQQPQPQQPQQ